MAEETTTNCNVQTIRKEEIARILDALSAPYNQYDNDYNRKILKSLIVPMLNRSVIGYQHFFNYKDQSGEILDMAIYALLRIKRSFLNITLSDENYMKLVNFAIGIRMIDTNNVQAIAEQIEKHLTKNFYVITQSQQTLYITFLEDDLLQGLIYYKLIPDNICSNTYILNIPIKYIGCKIWWWATNLIGTTKFYMPTLGAYWLYNKDTSPKVLSNPLIINPKWITKISDN